MVNRRSHGIGSGRQLHNAQIDWEVLTYAMTAENHVQLIGTYRKTRVSVELQQIPFEGFPVVRSSLVACPLILLHEEW
jgi:hypothetical protein